MADGETDRRRETWLTRPIRLGLPARLADFVSRWRRRPSLHRHELSVVACDLRGFTRFSAAVSPEDVVELLRGYYRGIGEAVAASRGMIKDHAGDGALALVGAARPSRDHATQAVAMAIAFARVGEELRRRWRTGALEIGLGIGVASGEVTVGTIHAGRRIEPVAIGAAVNLASRLCARAAAGQILVDERTVELLRVEERTRVQRLDAAELKGFARPVAIFQAIP
jgi:adenylate cyclase